jgi:hypothetical protein
MTIIREINPEDVRIYWIFEAMRKFGGGFVKLLGNLGAHADDNNIARIRGAWPEYWKQYEEMGISLQKSKDKERE